MKTKRTFKTILHDKSVAIIAILSVTLIVMTSLVLGVNISADLFGGLFSITTQQTPASERIQGKVEQMVRNNETDKLLKLLKENEIKTPGAVPSDLTGMTLSEFNTLVHNADPDSIKVHSGKTSDGTDSIHVQFGEQIFVTDNNWTDTPTGSTLMNSADGNFFSEEIVTSP